MPRDLTNFSGLHEDKSQLLLSLVAIDLPTLSIFAATGDTTIYVNLTTAATRTTAAAGYTAFAPYPGIKVPTLKSMEAIQLQFSNGDDFWGGVNATGGYLDSEVTIWQGQVDTADQSDPDQFIFSSVVVFYAGQLKNIIRAYDIATLKVDPHPNANTVRLPRERYDQVRFKRCPPPGFVYQDGYTTRTL